MVLYAHGGKNEIGMLDGLESDIRGKGRRVDNGQIVAGFSSHRQGMGEARRRKGDDGRRLSLAGIFPEGS
jgi:hypothetical protein